MVLLRRVFLWLVVFAAGVGVAWLVLPRFITPDEAEAVREPPPPDPITAPVEVGVLREVLVLDAEVRPRIEVSVEAWMPAAAARQVVTFLPDAGSVVNSGGPVVGLSERPLIFVAAMPNLYRDLHRGLTGPDVETLQLALLELGYLDDDDGVDGVFGSGTEEAVAAWYEAIGFAPAPPPEEVTSASVLEAQNAVDQARQVLNDARSGGDATAVATARRSLSIAESQLDALRQAPVLTVPADEILGLPYETLVVEGSSFREGDLVDPERSLVDLRTLDVLVVAPVTLAQMARLSDGQPVVVFGAGREVDSTLEEILVAEPGSGAEGFVRVDADIGEVTPGTPVRVEVEVAATATDVVSVPMSAVRTNADGTSYVTVLGGDASADVTVETGVTIGGRTEITSGLDGGERVVVG